MYEPEYRRVQVKDYFLVSDYGLMTATEKLAFARDYPHAVEFFYGNASKAFKTCLEEIERRDFLWSNLRGMRQNSSKRRQYRRELWLSDGIIDGHIDPEKIMA